MTHEARAVINFAAVPASEPYGAVRAKVLSEEGFAAALAEISSWPSYAPLPLERLLGLAKTTWLGSDLLQERARPFGPRLLEGACWRVRGSQRTAPARDGRVWVEAGLLSATAVRRVRAHRAPGRRDLRQRRPRFVVVEPMHADCVYRSIEGGKPVVVEGSLDTVMAGLACGEVSELAWEILRGGVNVAMAIDDAYAIEAMQRLVRPSAGGKPIVAGETGGAGLRALLAARDDRHIREVLALDEHSRVLLIGSEGATDPVIHREVVGRTAEEVLA